MTALGREELNEGCQIHGTKEERQREPAVMITHRQQPLDNPEPHLRPDDEGVLKQRRVAAIVVRIADPRARSPRPLTEPQKPRIR